MVKRNITAIDTHKAVVVETNHSHEVLITNRHNKNECHNKQPQHNEQPRQIYKQVIISTTPQEEHFMMTIFTINPKVAVLMEKSCRFFPRHAYSNPCQQQEPLFSF